MRRPLMLLLAAVLLLAACQAPAAAPTQAPAQKPAEQQPAAAQPTAAPAIPQQPPAQPAPATSAPLATAQPKAGPSQSGGVLTPPTTVPTPRNNPANVDTAPKGWVKLESKIAPPARYDHAFTVTQGYAFMAFGGRANNALGDTWSYGYGATGDWGVVTSTSIPPARFGITAAFDGLSAYIFGGQSRNIFLNDVWIFSPYADWRKITTTGDIPSPRAGASLAVGPNTETSSLYPLLTVSHGYSAHGYLDDMYILNLQTNVWQKISPSIRPAKRAGQATAFDTDSDRMYFFGGQNEQGSFLADLWVFDPVKKSWTELKPNGAKPTARADATLTYDYEGHLWLFGGKTISGVINELWRYDPNTNQWALVSAANGPSARSKHRATWDPVMKLVIFGGMDANGNALNDLWEFTP